MTKKILGIIVILTIIVTLTGCAQYNLDIPGTIKKTDKTIIVPSTGMSMPAIKSALRKNGWKVKVSNSGTIQKGTMGQETNLKTNIYYNARYRLEIKELIRSSSWVIKVFISVIDNTTQEEILSLEGDSLGLGGAWPKDTAKELIKALNEIEN